MLETKVSPEELAVRLNMAPHPEGGYYVETYRSAGTIPASALPPDFNGERSYSTAIIFLLTEGDKSRLHRIRQDEVWHFYLGGPLRLVMISPEGELSEIVLGHDIPAGQRPQFTVSAGCWFGAEPRPGSGYCLVGCTVAPGFDFADFKLADGEELRKIFPAHCGLIADFT